MSPCRGPRVAGPGAWSNEVPAFPGIRLERYRAGERTRRYVVTCCASQSLQSWVDPRELKNGNEQSNSHARRQRAAFAARTQADSRHSGKIPRLMRKNSRWLIGNAPRADADP